MCLVLVAVCFSAGFLLFPPAPSPGPQTAPAADVPAQLVVAPPEAGDTPMRKYNVTIDTTADWSRAILTDAKFTTGDGAAGLNDIDLSSESPEQVNRLVYAPGEVRVNQKPWGAAHIVIKCVVETTRPMLEFRTGHGDNGKITISSAVDSFTNDQTLGDGQNFVVGAIKLE